jgi:hypothetical protein
MSRSRLERSIRASALAGKFFADAGQPRLTRLRRNHKCLASTSMWLTRWSGLRAEPGMPGSRPSPLALPAVPPDAPEDYRIVEITDRTLRTAGLSRNTNHP